MGNNKNKLIEYLKNNYSKKSKSKIIYDLGLSWGYIQKVACLNKIKREFNDSKNDGKYLNLTDINNLITCYWIGFLLADGHIYKEKNIQINLSNVDKDHILKIESHIGKVRILEYANVVRITISDRLTAKFLSDKFKWQSNKTKNPPLIPNLSRDQLFSLIVGFIDGDGSIHKKGTIKIKCDSSWKDILDLFYFELTGEDKKFNITTCGCSIMYISKLETLFSIKEKAQSLNLPIMDRKWNKIKRRILKKDKYSIVRSLINEGVSGIEINKMGFSKSIIYKVKNNY